MRAWRTSGKLILLAAACALAVLAVGCSGDAFESNDYYMTFLTSQAIGKQATNSSGRAKNDIAEAVLQASVIVDETRQADERHEEAMEHYGNGDFDLAAQALDEAIQRRPDDIRYREDRAMVALLGDEPDEALVQWEEQDRIASLYGWADTEDYWMRNRSRAANLTHDLELEPSSPEADAQLAAAYNRYADTLDGSADYNEAAGADALLLDTMRTDAASYRRKAEALRAE